MRGVLRLEMVWFCRGLHRDGGLGVESFKTLKYGCQQGLPNAMASRTSLWRWLRAHRYADGGLSAWKPRKTRRVVVLVAR